MGLSGVYQLYPSEGSFERGVWPLTLRHSGTAFSSLFSSIQFYSVLFRYLNTPQPHFPFRFAAPRTPLTPYEQPQKIPVINHNGPEQVQNPGGYPRSER